MSDNTVQSQDSSMFITNAIGRLLVTSLLTALILKLANRMTIRANINFKTAYIVSLATNAISLGISTLISLIFTNIEQLPMFIVTMVLVIPIQAVVYQRMIHHNDGSNISVKSSYILSSSLVGIVILIPTLIIVSTLVIRLFK